jgi:hypothetical protein
VDRGETVEEGRKQAPKRLGDLMAKLLRSTARPRRRELAEIAAAWARAVGPEVARRSSPIGFRGGELTVSFQSSALRQEVVAFRKAEILAKLGRECAGTRVATLKCVLR